MHRPGPSGIRPKWEPPHWNPLPLDSQSNRSHRGCTSNTTTVNECESRYCVLKRHLTVRLGCKSRASVKKLHPNLIEASEGDEIVLSWQGDSRLLNNLETREANKKGRNTKEDIGDTGRGYDW